MAQLAGSPGCDDPQPSASEMIPTIAMTPDEPEPHSAWSASGLLLLCALLGLPTQTIARSLIELIDQEEEASASCPLEPLLIHWAMRDPLDLVTESKSPSCSLSDLRVM